MKHKLLLILLVIGAVWLQSCKKKNSADNTSSTTTPAPVFNASINGSDWTPDTLSATITYNAAASIKVLNLTGTKSQKRVTMALTLSNATNDNTIATGTYRVDGTNGLVMTYYTLQKSSTGAYVFVPHGTVQPGSGSLIITAVDASAKTITGTFSFTSTNITRNTQGDITSVDVANITSGQFNGLPFTYTAQ
jgi:hypothetical protein